MKDLLVVSTLIGSAKNALTNRSDQNWRSINFIFNFRSQDRSVHPSIGFIAEPNLFARD